jgi:hypothetical protein
MDSVVNWRHFDAYPNPNFQFDDDPDPDPDPTPTFKLLKSQILFVYQSSASLSFPSVS